MSTGEKNNAEINADAGSILHVADATKNVGVPRLSLRPGRNMLRIAGGLAVCSLVSFVWPDIVWLLFAAACVVLIMAVVEYRVLARWIPRIKCTRTLPNLVGRDLPFRVTWTIEHDIAQPLAIELRDQVPVGAVPSFQTHRLQLAAAIAHADAGSIRHVANAASVGADRQSVSPESVAVGLDADAGSILHVADATKNVGVPRLSLRPGRNMLRIAGGLAVCSLVSFVWPDIVWLLFAAACVVLIMAVVEYRVLARWIPRIKCTRTLPNLVGRDLPFRVTWTIEHDIAQPLAIELRDQVPVGAVPSFQTHRLQLAAAIAHADAGSIRHVANAASVGPERQRASPGSVAAGLDADAGSIRYVANAASVGADGIHRGKSRESVSTEFRIPVRGAFEFGPIWLRVAGFWELLEAKWSLPGLARVKVLPEAYSTGEALKQDKRAAMLLLDKLAQARQQGMGTEFDQLSEFRDGDDPRRIDWRTTARYGRPVVRRFRVERHRDVMLVIDCGRLMGADAVRGTKLDCAVDSALMLGRTVLDNGDRCGLAMFDDQVLGYLPPVSGKRALRALAESVCNVQSRWREADFTRMFATLQARQSKRSLLVILSDIVDEATSTRFRASLGALCRRHVVLFAALQTPLLKQVTRNPVETLLDGARQAVAYRLLREREQALQSLRHGGVHVVDVEPNELTVPLINSFIELRSGNLL